MRRDRTIKLWGQTVGPSLRVDRARKLRYVFFEHLYDQHSDELV